MLERIRQLSWARPFQPFTIYLADGRSIPVTHPESLAISHSGKTISVYQPDDTLSIINLAMVTEVNVRPESSSVSKA